MLTGRLGGVSVEIGRFRFDELVSEALDQVPPELAREMDNVVVLVEDRNPEDPSILGLYEGVALTERTHDYAGSLPDRIYIYRDAILDFCADEDQVVEEVMVTVVHEIAHHFGIDDERLHELGWE
jgi:predicted Zn-dependent protease with MMP-like domain